MQCNAMQCNAIQCNAMQCNVMYNVSTCSRAAARGARDTTRRFPTRPEQTPDIPRYRERHRARARPFLFFSFLFFSFPYPWVVTAFSSVLCDTCSNAASPAGLSRASNTKHAPGATGRVTRKRRPRHAKNGGGQGSKHHEPNRARAWRECIE